MIEFFALLIGLAILVVLVLILGAVKTVSFNIVRLGALIENGIDVRDSSPS